MVSATTSERLRREMREEELPEDLESRMQPTGIFCEPGHARHCLSLASYD